MISLAFYLFSSNLRFLAAFLAGHPLPESIGLLTPPMTTPYTPNGGSIELMAASSYPLRTQLLKFLLPPVVLEGGRSAPVGGASGPHQLSAKVLMDAR